MIAVAMPDEMSREQKIRFIIQGHLDIQDAVIPVSYFDKWTDEEIDKECDWVDYLLDK